VREWARRWLVRAQGPPLRASPPIMLVAFAQGGADFLESHRSTPYKGVVRKPRKGGIYDCKQAYRKTAQIQRIHCGKLSIQETGQRVSYRGQTLQDRLSMSPLRSALSDLTHLLPRVWRDLPVSVWSVFLWYCPKEILCPTHGRVQEQIPCAAPNSRVTYRFEHALLVYCQLMTQKAAGRLLHMAASTVSDQLHAAVTPIRAGHKIRGLKSIGIDEISYCKGHKYATIVYDLDRSCVLWVRRGKGGQTINEFLTHLLSEQQKKQIQWACCDTLLSKINQNSDFFIDKCLISQFGI